jgi:hypothetical protein
LSDTGTSFSVNNVFLMSITIDTSRPGRYVFESRERERLSPLAEVDEAELTLLTFVDVGDVGIIEVEEVFFDVSEVVWSLQPAVIISMPSDNPITPIIRGTHFISSSVRQDLINGRIHI